MTTAPQPLLPTPTGDPARTRPVRLACYASVERNAYVRLFYQALERRGIQRVQLESSAVLFDPEALRELATRVDGIYLHWVEGLWRDHSTRLPWRLRGVAGLRKLARLVRGLAAARAAGLSVFWTVHNLDAHEPDTFVDRLGRYVLGYFAELRVCHSRDAAAEVRRRYGGAAERTVLMYHGNYGAVYGRGAEGSAFVEGLGLESGRRTLLCFGNIRPYKGFDTAIDALRRLGPGYQLVVAGKPLNEEAERELRARAHGLPNVSFAFRFLDDAEMAAAFDAADCVLLPYRQISGSGALLATLTQGRGVVAADLPYFREMLEPEPDAGVLHTPGDAGSLAAAIERFFTLPPHERHAAARRLGGRFDWETVIEPVADAIHRVVGERTGGSR